MQIDQSGERGIFKQVFDTLSRAVGEDSGSSLLDEILNNTGDLIDRAHDAINHVSLILKHTQVKLGEIGKNASARFTLTFG